MDDAVVDYMRVRNDCSTYSKKQTLPTLPTRPANAKHCGTYEPLVGGGLVGVAWVRKGCLSQTRLFLLQNQPTFKTLHVCHFLGAVVCVVADLFCREMWVFAADLWISLCLLFSRCLLSPFRCRTPVLLRLRFLFACSLNHKIMIECSMCFLLVSVFVSPHEE